MVRRIFDDQMNRFIPLLIVGCIACAGCATNYVVEWKAKPHVGLDKKEQTNVQVAGQPGYYALLPLSIPFDIATCPVQLCILLAWPAAKAPGSKPALAPMTNSPSVSTNK
jgi:hypothetical protein